MAASRIFRVFVSSTFSDFENERDALRVVWLNLEKLCANNGASFQVVDLRWGISSEEANSHETLQICLDEIVRCQQLSPKPNFIILMGNRYGWRPLPASIPVDDFERIKVNWPADKLSLLNWYRLDENAIPPHYTLLPPATNAQRWNFDEPHLASLLRQVANALSLSSTLYCYSATHREILKGLLEHPEAKEHVFCFKRTITGLPELSDDLSRKFADYSADGSFDTEAKNLLSDLHNSLEESLPGEQTQIYDVAWSGNINRPISLDHLEQLQTDVESCLTKIIKDQLSELSETDHLQQENADHFKFAEDTCKFFSGREDSLELVRKHLQAAIGATPLSPIIVTSPAGFGKSALMARLLLNIMQQPADEHTTLVTHKPAVRVNLAHKISSAGSAVATTMLLPENTVVIGRFVGATPRSWEPESFLVNLIRQIERAYGQTETLLPDGGLTKLSECLSSKLLLASPDRPIVLLIDALDQFSENNPWLLETLLPKVLPPHVALVCSVLDGAEHNYLASLTTLYPGILHHALTPLTADLCGDILDANLRNISRKVTATQKECLLKNAKGSPLYTTLLLPLARKIHSWEEPAGLPVGETELAKHLVIELAKKGYRLLTIRALGYIRAARFGLSERELLEVLWRDKDVRGEFEAFCEKAGQPPPAALPLIVWSRIYAELDTYINEFSMDGELLYRFFHRLFGEVATELNRDVMPELHGRLADYFGEQEYYHSRQPNGRKVMELPWQLLKAGRAYEAEAIITDFDFAMAKCQFNRSDDWLDDFRMVMPSLGATAKPESKIWETFVRTKAHILRRGNDEWPAHKILLQLAMEHADDSPVTIAAENWAGEATDNWLWLRAAYRTHHLEHNSHLFSIDDREKIHYLQLSPNNECLLAPCGNTIKSFDLEVGRLLRCYDGHEGAVTGISWLNENSFISWSKDESVILWDVECSTPKKRIDGLNRPFYSANCNDRGEVLLWSGEVGRIEGVGHDRTAWEYGPIERSHFASSVRIESICKKINQLALSIPYQINGIEALNHLIEMSNLYDILSEKTDVNISSTIELSLMGDYYFNKKEMPSHHGSKDDTKENLRRFNRNLLFSNITADLKTTFILWDTAREQRQLFQGHEGEVLGAAFVGDKEVISWSIDETIRIWDKATTQCIAVITELGAMVSHLEIISAERAVACDLHGYISLLDIPKRKCLSREKSYHKPSHVEVVRFRMIDDNTLFAWTRDEIQIWSIRQYRFLGNKLKKIAAISAQSTSKYPDLLETVLKLPNGLIVWNCEGNIYYWDYQKSMLGTLNDVLSSPTDQVATVGLKHVVDNIIVTWSNGHAFALFDLESRELLKVFPPGTSPITGIYAFDRQRLATIDGKIRVYNYNGKDNGIANKYCSIWRLNDPYCHLLPGKKSYLLMKCISPIAIIQLWDIESGMCLNQFTVNHTNGDSGIECMVLDTNHLLTNGALKEVKVWDISNGSCVCDLTEKIESLSDLENILRYTGLYTKNFGDYKLKLDKELGPFSLNYKFSGYRIGRDTVRWEDDSTVVNSHGFADLCTIVTSSAVLHLYKGRDKIDLLQFLEDYLVSCRRDGDNLEWCLEQIGDYYYKAKEFAKAIEIYKELFDCCKDEKRFGVCLFKMAETFMANRDLDRALKLYILAADDVDYIGFEKEDLIKAYMGQVTTLKKQGRIEEALVASDKLLQDERIRWHTGIEWGKAILQRSGIFYKLEQYQDARDNAYEALWKFTEENHAIGIMSVYKQLGIIYSTEGNMPEAVVAVKKAIDYGLANVERFLCKPCFNLLRSRPEYFELLNAKRPWRQIQVCKELRVNGHRGLEVQWHQELP